MIFRLLAGLWGRIETCARLHQMHFTFVRAGGPGICRRLKHSKWVGIEEATRVCAVPWPSIRRSWRIESEKWRG